ncbi:S8 family peptidase [Acidobacteriia bacterium AH_259_A11_L15]|nr:S8 family peptidase [Acidobacteriia bacterium AH_259_A11_L15]
MAKRNVIIELAHGKKLESFAHGVMMHEVATLDLGVVPKLETLQYDQSFPTVPLPRLSPGEHQADAVYDTSTALEFDASLAASTYLVRGTVDEEAINALEQEAKKNPAVVGIYADVAIQPMIVCPGSAPVGDDSTVEGLLCVNRLHRAGIDGRGVLVAIVDTGVNIAYLNSRGKTPVFDAGRSWAWDPAQVTPGSVPVDHGTMCAFDVCIAAPRCTLLDIALLHPVSAGPGTTIMESLLSDAIRAYRQLLNVMNAPRRPGEGRSLVVNNSWGMFHPSWDWPVGDPRNYSDNPSHPFNRIVATLERAGADILFAAGNCGADCPDGRCQGVTTRAIYGANSSPQVTCVAGVDTTKTRVGYSAIGPGRLENRKPDICGYTHFSGSGVYTADGGTSAACPVVAGVVAAIRSKRPYDPGSSETSPAAIRNLLTTTAEDLGASGYDYQHGYGVVSGCNLANKLAPKLPDICLRFPWLCWPNLCRRYPWLCDRRWWLLPVRQPIGPIPPIRPRLGDLAATEGPIPEEELKSFLSELLPGAKEEEITAIETAYQIGFSVSQYEAQAERKSKPKPEDCGCKQGREKK